MTTYYRAAPDRPTADHAWSAPMGSTWIDRTHGLIECDRCDGTGHDTVTGGHCPRCDHGAVQADRGYSSSENIDDIIDRFGADAPIWAYHGTEVGLGLELEPLVIPDDTTIRTAEPDLALHARSHTHPTRTHDDTPCRIWDAALDHAGYPVLKIAGVTWRAHRLAWTLTGADTTPEEDRRRWRLRNLCGRTDCINPHHWEPWTRTWNR